MAGKLVGRPVDCHRRGDFGWSSITSGGRTYFGTLVEGGARDEATGRYRARTDQPQARAEFYRRRRSGPSSTGISGQQLRGKPLALWLHGLLCEPRFSPTL